MRTKWLEYDMSYNVYVHYIFNEVAHELSSVLSSILSPYERNTLLKVHHIGCVFCDAVQIRCAFFDPLRAHRVFLRDASLSVKDRKSQL